MEMYERDFEQEIKPSSAINRIYTDVELSNVILQLVYFHEKNNETKIFHLIYANEYSEAGKYALLSAYGVEVRHLDFKLMENIEEDPCEEDISSYNEQKKKIEDFNKAVYTDFYRKAIEDIRIDAGL